MEPNESLKEILGQIDKEIEMVKNIGENILGTMEEIDKDIGFFLENKETDMAAKYLLAFNEIKVVAEALLLLCFRQLHYTKEILTNKTNGGADGEEHKATTEP